MNDTLKNTVLASLPDKNGKVRVPSRPRAIELLLDLRELLFPSYFSDGDPRTKEELFADAEARLVSSLTDVFAFTGKEPAASPEAIAEIILSRLPDVRKMLDLDVTALYEGDPAATCREEVVLAYPGFFAIMIYRLAHEFYKLGVPLLPRLFTEYAHEKTGIDIHAGATIGAYFFIDHGTGTVIGETTTIGDHVKIYQGVTLGAKSFELDASGNPVKDIKRHPDIGDRVILYANATILGGSTVIGDDCVIGGNVWLTHSVAPGTVVSYSENITKKEKSE